MDKIIIYGVFEFVGFHFCNRLLEKGFNVKGIHFNLISNEYIEEKRLLIGRNANFEELTAVQIRDRTEDNDGSAIIIFSLYDLFMTNKEAVLKDKLVYEPIIQLLEKRKEQQDKIVFLLPVQLLADSCAIAGRAELENFLLQTSEITKKAHFFYLPTIFGPWQPPTFLFQRTISDQQGEAGFTVREWVKEAVFIDDALEPIIKMIVDTNEGRFLLESGISDSWRKCAAILNVDSFSENTGENLNIISEQIIRLPLTKVTPYTESLAVQRDHFLQIARLRG